MPENATTCTVCGYAGASPSAKQRLLPWWLTLLLVGSTATGVILLPDNPLWQVIVGACGHIFWGSLAWGLWRLLNGE
ncbi:MAG: hypothetical protein SNJ82_03795 [Gemmataceae bacterium]